MEFRRTSGCKQAHGSRFRFLQLLRSEYFDKEREHGSDPLASPTHLGLGGGNEVM